MITHKFFRMLSAAAMVALGTFLLASCGGDDDVNEPTPVPVSNVTVSPTTLTLVEGGSTASISASVSPDNASDKTVTWSSSNESVATVSNGTVTPKSAGTATITAKAGGKSATCSVTVEKSVVSVTGVELDKTTLELTEGNNVTLTATVKPDGATNKNVKWASSDDKVATVDNGKVAAVKAGTAKITVTTEDGGKTATCEVTVKAATVSVTGVELDKTSITMVEGDVTTLKATVKPDNATNKNVKWTSADDKVATVDNGKVTAVKAGTVKITVTTEDGEKTASCDVTVEKAVVSVTGVELDKTTLELIEGDNVSLTANVKPADATNKNVKWSSDNTDVATVDNGKVTAVKAGTATITVTTEDGGKTATCDVVVLSAAIPVTGVTLDKSTLELVVGESETLTATVNPDNATNKNVEWSTSGGVVSVEDGVVKALKPGTAKVVVTTEDGSMTATCEVTVKEATVSVTSVSLDETSLELTEGDNATLMATVNPENATNKNVTWTSSDDKVATVDNGKVTAVKAGTATITVTTEDGNKTASCDVTVKAAIVPVTGVTLNKSNLELVVGGSETLIATVQPENATNKNVKWSTSSAALATVVDGTVNALKSGTVKITVTTEDGSMTATCVVSIKSSDVSVTGVSLNKSTLTLVEGGTETLTATVSPENATNKNVTWTSSDESVATVENGKVTAVKVGTSTITVRTADGGKTASCTVTVKTSTVQVMSIALNKQALTLTEGGSETLTVKILPLNATNKNVTWTSSDESVATVENGKVTAVKAGTATITVTTEDGKRSDSCVVTVNEYVPVTGVILERTSITMRVGDSGELRYSVRPTNATNQNVTWASSDEKVVKVRDGIVTAVGMGVATVGVITEDGRKAALCEVTVKRPPVSVTDVTLNKSTLTLVEGGTETLTATVSPESATNKNVTWTSSDESVATVENGKVTAVKAGTATITVTTEDGKQSDSCVVTVNEYVPVTGVILEKTSITMRVGDSGELRYSVRPTNATNQNVMWASSDEKVVEVRDGIVTAVGMGVATVGVITEDGRKAALCEVTVRKRAIE